MCLYRGNAIGQVVLAGDTQQFILWQLKATEGTWSSFLLHLWCVWMSVDQDPNAVYVKEGEEVWSRQRMEWSTYVWRNKQTFWKTKQKETARAVWIYRTIASIFFLYVGLISLRYSGLISMAAKLKAEFFSPARWHSITADVSMGTTSTNAHTYTHTHWWDVRLTSLFFFQWHLSCI